MEKAKKKKLYFNYMKLILGYEFVTPSVFTLKIFIIDEIRKRSGALISGRNFNNNQNTHCLQVVISWYFINLGSLGIALK